MTAAQRKDTQKKTSEALRFMQMAQDKLRDDDRFDLVGARALLGMAKLTLEAIDRAITNG